MIQKVRNVVGINCNAVDFTTAENMEIYIVQGMHRFVYPLVAISEHTATFNMPKTDAMKLSAGDAKIQFAVTVGEAPVISAVKKISIGELLRWDGYGSD